MLNTELDNVWGMLTCALVL